MSDKGVKARRLVGLFLIGCVLSNYPIISLFNLKRMFLGFPLLYLYMFSIWGGMVLLIFWITRSSSENRRPVSAAKSEQTAP